MAKCAKCLEVIKAMGCTTPVDWLPFAWGPSSTDPMHYYVFPEAEKDKGDNGPEEVSAMPICGIENPVSRVKGVSA